jgi:hypothetical protein
MNKYLEIFAAGLATGVILTCIVLGLVALVHDFWFKPVPNSKTTDKESS